MTAVVGTKSDLKHAVSAQCADQVAAVSLYIFVICCTLYVLFLCIFVCG